jgi:hypothetical protein
LEVVNVSDQLDKALKNFKRLDEERTRALEVLSALQNGPRIINASDQKAINENMLAISEGTAIVVQGAGRKRRALRANEIDKRDSERLAKHFEQVKNGIMVVVDQNALEYENATK